MAKADGPLREDGKRLKPEGWEPPQLKNMLLDWQIARIKGKKPIPAIYACQCEEAGVPKGKHIAGCIESPVSSRADPEAYTDEPRKCAYCSQVVGNWEDLRQHVKSGGCFEPIPDPPWAVTPLQDVPRTFILVPWDDHVGTPNTDSFLDRIAQTYDKHEAVINEILSEQE